MIDSYKVRLAAAAERWRKGRNLGKIVPRGKPETQERNERKDSSKGERVGPYRAF